MITLQPFDIVLALLLIGFVFWGFKNGLIRAFGGLIGIFVAIFVAGRFYLMLASWIALFFGTYQGLAVFVSFALIFLLVGKLFGLVVLLFERAFDILAFLPFLKGINYLLGGIFGFVIGTIMMGTLLYVAGQYIQWQQFIDILSQSSIAQFLLRVANYVAPLLPDALIKLRSAVG